MDIKVIASGSSGNAYLAGDGSSCLLLDAGIPIKILSAGCDYKLSELSGCLITHTHADHSRAIDDLLRRGIKVYGPPDMVLRGWEINGLRAMQKVSIGTFDIIPFALQHDVQCFGYHLHSLATDERLVYITDTASICHVFQNINYWLIEANYDIDILDRNVADGMDRKRANRVIETHLGIDQVEDYMDGLDTSMAKEIYLCHLSNDNSNADDFRRRIERVTGVPVYIAGEK